MKAPINIQLEITNACNNRCDYCYKYGRGGNHHLKKEELKKIFDELGETTFSVIITGGEPFMNRPTLYEAVNKCSEKNIDVSINTNLTLLKKDDLINFGDKIVGMLISFPSYKEQDYNKITNSKNYYNFISNLKAIEDAQFEKEVNMVVILNTATD